MAEADFNTARREAYSILRSSLKNDITKKDVEDILFGFYDLPRVYNDRVKTAKDLIEELENLGLLSETTVDELADKLDGNGLKSVANKIREYKRRYIPADNVQSGLPFSTATNDVNTRRSVPELEDHSVVKGEIEPQNSLPSFEYIYGNPQLKVPRDIRWIERDSFVITDGVQKAVFNMYGNGNVKRLFPTPPKLQHPYSPMAIAVWEEKIFVTDLNNKCVHYFSKDTSKFLFLSSFGIPQLERPIGIDIDAKGNVYVADYVKKEIVQFDANHSYVRSLLSDDRSSGSFLEKPEMMKLTKSQDQLVVADQDDQVTNPSIKIVDIQANRILRVIRIECKSVVALPFGIAIDFMGRIFVSASKTNGKKKRLPYGVILVYSAEGNALGVVNNVGRDMTNPGGLDIQGQGTLYVTDMPGRNERAFVKRYDIMI